MRFLIGPSPLTALWDLLLDPHVGTRQTQPENQSVAPGVLEHHGPRGHFYVHGRGDPAPPEPAIHGLRPGHLLCGHHPLVHPSVRHLWCQQIPWSVRDDDWKDG